ncbi:histidine kinase [Yinghuangia sp. ASG 101]|uniref:sensor histidine kinase n=1 Tax=Yinghuangia sp. ASG 101 TaxID=2896848 RepID=UPI001E4D2302|nr:histidine kinase [Yinghuangia sp. ASG 101]UGQ11671.1 histidine kinase [Yinghuangia sp. ASG 101]
MSRTTIARIRRTWPLSPRTFDRVFALGFLFLVAVAFGIAAWVDRDEHIAGMEYVKAVTQLLSVFLLVWRRTHPIAVAVGCGLLSVPEQAVAMPWALYAVGAFTENRRAVWASVVPLSVLWARPWDLVTASDQIGNVLIGLAPALYGLYVASRRRLIAALEERAERAEREQELRAENARSEERARLAGEMHDVVTHRVSLMVLQAGALRTLAPDAGTRRAAEDLRLVGCQAMEELRNLVTILRSEDSFGSALDDRPCVLDLTTLVAESRAAGVEVALDADAVPPASPVVVRTAYRVVQESLTNVHKHAPGARVAVELRDGDGRLRLEVRNTRPTGPGEMVFPGEGTGLLGLRRRVETVGGTLRAGPTGDGGFAVAADLPTGTPVESGTATGGGATGSAKAARTGPGEPGNTPSGVR